MSLLLFQNFLTFAEAVIAAKGDLPPTINAVELESVLVSHGVVLLYAQMEQCFQKALEIKCTRCNDIEVRTFALSVKNDKTGKLKLSEVKGTFKRFGIDHNNSFTAHLEASNLKESWDSVVNHRATVAHYGQPAGLTFAELRSYYQGICRVLGLICNCLSLSEQEVQQIGSFIVMPPKATLTPSSTTSPAPSSPQNLGIQCSET